MNNDQLKQVYGLLDELPRTIRKRVNLQAVLGNGQGAVKVPNRPGFVYARLKTSAGTEAVIHVYAPNVRHTNNNPVEICRNQYGFYETVGVDQNEGPEFWTGFSTGGGGPHAESHGLYGDDVLWLDTRQLLPFLVHPTDPASLSVYMEPGLFRNLAGEWVGFIGGTVNLSSFVPTNLNEQVLVVVGLDKDTEANTVEDGTATVFNNYQPETVPFTAANVATLLNAAAVNFVPKMAVRLAYGQTQIQQWDCFLDCRTLATDLPLLPPEVGGSGLDNTALEGYVFHNLGTNYGVRIIGQQTTAPTVNDDANDLFITGSQYYTHQSSWTCLDNTAGAAVWTSGVFYSEANVSNPPTDAELDSALGTPADAGAGFTAVVNDNGDGTNVYLVSSTGANWAYVAMTIAT